MPRIVPVVVESAVSASSVPVKAPVLLIVFWPVSEPAAPP